MVPQTTDTSGVVNNAHLEIAEVGVDYLDSATLAGMIVFFPVGHVPAGYLVCNGDTYSKELMLIYINTYLMKAQHLALMEKQMINSRFQLWTGSL